MGNIIKILQIEYMAVIFQKFISFLLKNALFQQSDQFYDRAFPGTVGPNQNCNRLKGDILLGLERFVILE